MFYYTSYRTWIKSTSGLTSLIGVFWILGPIVALSDSIFVAYILIVLNSTQGVFILLFHFILSEKA